MLCGWIFTLFLWSQVLSWTPRVCNPFLHSSISPGWPWLSSRVWTGCRQLDVAVGGCATTRLALAVIFLATRGWHCHTQLGINDTWPEEDMSPSSIFSWCLELGSFRRKVLCCTSTCKIHLLLDPWGNGFISNLVTCGIIHLLVFLLKYSYIHKLSMLCLGTLLLFLAAAINFVLIDFWLHCTTKKFKRKASLILHLYESKHSHSDVTAKALKPEEQGSFYR